jgi:Enolase, N-terminal domain
MGTNYKANNSTSSRERRTSVSFERRKLLASRSKSASRVSIKLDDGHHAIASVPLGAATGEHEASELRNADPAQYVGKGDIGAAANMPNVIASKGRRAPADTPARPSGNARLKKRCSFHDLPQHII